MGATYLDAGVDIDGADTFIQELAPLIQSTSRKEVLGGIGGFSGLFRLPQKRYQQPVLVATTDGVGTKLKIAKIVGNHSTIGIDLVAMCVNDLIVVGAEPLFFLDYFATGKLNQEQAKEVLRGIIDGCKQAGCALLGGETAEMPGFYPPEEYDLAGFAVGIVEEEKILGQAQVTEEDTIIGLASNGVHSNGFSLVRKAFEKEFLADPQTSSDFRTWLLSELMKPTKIYVSLISSLQKEFDLHALAHITGGGLPGNLSRVIPLHLTAKLQEGSWPVPAIFKEIQQQGKIEKPEMFRTFNQGIGMAIVLPRHQEKAILQAVKQMGWEAFSIGKVSVRGNAEKAVSFV